MDILEINSMGEFINGKQSQDLEKTRAELRKTFSAAEEYRTELEYLQKGGNPLDLRSENVGSVSEAKGSFAITASHHEDSVGSSGRLGVQLVCESNTADNLVLFNGESKIPEVENRSVSHLTSGQNIRKSTDSAALELPKRSYERRVRSRPNHDNSRLSNFNSKITNLNSNSRLDTNGSSPAISDTNGSQNSQKNKHDSTKGLDAESSWTQKAQTLDGNNENEGLKGPVLESTFSVTVGPTDVSEQPQNSLNSVNTKHEDFILKEAQIIKAKQKLISELSVSTLQLHNNKTSHWDLVLEEMSWLANDFAQERIWKITAAAQISRNVAFASQIKYRQQIKQKEVAQSLGKYVMEFWHTTEVKCITNSKKGLQEYATRFLEYNNTHTQCSTAHVSSTADVISDVSIMSITCDDNLTQENLVYTVPPGATEAYRKSIESHLLQCERAWSGVEEEMDNKETRAYYSPQAYEMGDDLLFKQSFEKDTGNTLNVSLPIEHVRAASIQRVIGPFNGPNKIDAFSGNTESFQDEQNMGPQIEAESAVDFDEQLRFDLVDRPRKKKKLKHPQGTSFNKGLYIQPNIKKLKIRHSFDDFTPPSPVASHMSNPKKFMELLVHDRNKKSKTLKMPAGQPGSGSPWSLFEDQFLVVLVHDMGPNWDLITDVFNSNSQSKCIFRSSKECKERHKTIMEISSCDGAELSQSYPSTLPGIPEGSARQLFQQLQGPKDEKTLKSHFENIIIIGRKQYNTRKPNETQNPKHLQPPHSSHTSALSQVSPNNLIGGPVLTPLDLCDAITSTLNTPPVSNQGSDNGGPAISDHGNSVTMLSGPTSSSFVPGPSNLARVSPASGPLNNSIRDGKHGIPKTGSLPKEDQQRINHMLSASRPIRMLPSGGAMSAISRGMPMGRPSMLNHRAGLGQGSPILKPHDSMHLIRPNHNNDQQRQIPPVSQGQTSQQVPQLTTNTSHPAFGTQLVNERQPFPTSNPMMPHVQPPKSQLSITQTQKHPLLPPRGMMVNPHKVNNQIIPKQHHQKLVNLSQVKSAQKTVNNRLVNLKSSESLDTGG